MNSATPVIFAFFLVLSLPAMTVIAAEPSSETDERSAASLQPQPRVTAPAEFEDTTNRLMLPDDAESDHVTYKPDLATTLASVDDELRIDHDQYTIVERRFESATREERAAMVRTAYEQLRNRSAMLEQREQNAVQAHAAGDLSTAELLQTLVRNHNEAAELSESLRELEQRATDVPGARADYKTFDYHRTPLRENLDQLATDPTEGHHDIVVTTSENGYSLSMMDGDRYIVETTRFDTHPAHRDETTSDTFDDDEAYDHAKELYPWASDRPYFQDNSPDHYWAEMDHDQGQLEFYFNSETGDVYREVQVLSVPSLPSAGSVSTIDNGLVMTINTTPANGPSEVTVLDEETGEPVAATITVDGVEVGTTDDDGSLWVIPPVGSHELTAETDQGNVTRTMS